MTSRNELREILREAISEISEDVNCTSWGTDIEHVAWQLIHGEPLILTSFQIEPDNDVPAVLDAYAKLGEWPLPGSDGHEFVSPERFLPIHRGWVASENERKAALQLDEERRIARDLDESDIEVLRTYVREGRSDDVLRDREQIRNLTAKGYLSRSGDTWLPNGPTAAGREFLDENDRRPTI